MPKVGEQLRAAREARKLQVHEVATATNMRTDHVIALEEGNYAPFPAPVYIRGSVRTYAKLLKLDVMKIMEELAREMDQEKGSGDAPGGIARRRGLLDLIALQLAKFGWKRTLILLAILLALAIFVLLRSGGNASPEADPMVDLPPPTHQPPHTSDGGYLPLPNTNR